MLMGFANFWGRSQLSSVLAQDLGPVEEALVFNRVLRELEDMGQAVVKEEQ